MPANGTGDCSSRLPIPVLSEGARDGRSSVVSEYSNSKPMTSSPAPIAKPFAVRLDGDVFAPRNNVASAYADTGIQISRAAAESAIARRCLIRPMIREDLFLFVRRSGRLDGLHHPAETHL